MRGMRECSNEGQKRLLACMSWFCEFDPFVWAHVCLAVLAVCRGDGWGYGKAFMEEVGGRILKSGAQSGLTRGRVQKSGREG